MIKQDNLKVDLKKLNKEDRRFLLDRNLNELAFNLQGISSNYMMSLSALAILLSAFILVVQTDKLWAILLYVLVIVPLGLIYRKKFSRAKKNLLVQNKELSENYDYLFKEHFGYAFQ